MEKKTRKPLTHEAWLATEGIEYATHDETLAQECQKKRINWLVDNTLGTFVEFGCNYGYISASICGRYGYKGVGIDINVTNIELAQEKYSDTHNLYFMCRDIVNDDIDVFNIDTVLMPDVLEHIPYTDVKCVLEKACCIAKRRVLITLPWETEKRTCFKHRWLVNSVVIREMMDILEEFCVDVCYECDGDFVYIKGVKW